MSLVAAAYMALGVAVIMLIMAGRRNSAVAARKRSELLADVEAANRDLRDIQDRLSLAADVARIGLWELDLETGSLWVSEQLAAQTGDSPADWTAWSDLVERLHPEDRRDHLLAPPAKPVGDLNESLFRLRHRDGSFRRIRSRSGTVHQDGRPTRNVGAHIDVTEDQVLHLEEELLDSNERLQEFTRLANHDLRSPVRAIASLVRFVKEDGGPDLNEAALGHLEKVESRAARMNHLLDGLLEYTRAGERASTTESVDPLSLATEAIADIQRQGCQIEIQYSGPKINTWATPLATCIHNLVENSCKHHQGPTGRVEVKLAVVNGWLEVDIIDDGPGIPTQYLSQVFEPFRALQSSDEVEGSGIGLAVVRKTVKAHRGTLRLQSEVGVGTEFHIRWPLTEEPIDLERQTDAAPQQHRTPARR